jgi:hypothetical protein
LTYDVARGGLGRRHGDVEVVEERHALDRLVRRIVREDELRSRPATAERLALLVLDARVRIIAVERPADRRAARRSGGQVVDRRVRCRGARSATTCHRPARR